MTGGGKEKINMKKAKREEESPFRFAFYEGSEQNSHLV